MNPLISVIVPVYNVKPYLNKCLESIVGQTYRNLEIIVVDDGSTDGSEMICDDWASSDSRIRVIHQKNQGLSGARNTGIACAHGEYLCFVDSDDHISGELCQTVMKYAQAHDADIVRFGFDCNDDTLLEPEKAGSAQEMIDSREAVRRLLTGEFHDYAWLQIYRRDLFREIRYPVGKVFEDIGTTYRTFLAARNIYCISDRLYFYCCHKGSISQSINARSLCDLYEMRMQRHGAVKIIYPDFAELDLKTRASVARSVVERSWLEPVDRDVVSNAAEFLAASRSALCGNKKMAMYYAAPKVYRVYRILKHRLGRWIKVVLRLFK